jgi:hypothetical protein
VTVRRLRVGILDLVTKGPLRSVWGRLMQPNFASIMPQAVGVWAEEAGHEVRFVCYTGFEDLSRELPPDVDVLFVSAFTQAGHLAYAVSNLYRQRGVVTVLGGPHARCYPEDAARHFDYVLGLTDRSAVHDLLRSAERQGPRGVCLSASRQPASLPGLRERWKFVAPTVAKAPAIRIVPMIGSLGCPYTCSFCIDSVVDYQPLLGEQIQEDLRFLLRAMPRPRVAWHDPNFGVRFEETMSAIEEAVPPGRVEFAAESSLSLLSEPHLQRLRRNGFKAILPGIESWFSLGNKSRTGRHVGLEKVRQVSDHVNTILRYIPYVQTNFVLGLDDDEGPEPFALTKRFVELAPGAFPGYSLLTAFGAAAPLNLDLQREGRVLPFPFHFLNNNAAMNVRPRHYTWPALYDHVIDLRKHTFSWQALARRYRANQGGLSRSLNVVRALSTEGRGRIRYDTTVRRLLDHDASVRRFFESETDVLPAFYADQVRRDLGPFWDALPPGALRHDPNAYLKAQANPAPARLVRAESRAAGRVGGGMASG